MATSPICRGQKAVYCIIVARTKTSVLRCGANLNRVYGKFGVQNRKGKRRKRNRNPQVGFYCERVAGGNRRRGGRFRARNQKAFSRRHPQLLRLHGGGGVPVGPIFRRRRAWRDGGAADARGPEEKRFVERCRRRDKVFRRNKTRSGRAGVRVHRKRGASNRKGGRREDGALQIVFRTRRLFKLFPY